MAPSHVCTYVVTPDFGDLVVKKKTATEVRNGHGKKGSFLKKSLQEFGVTEAFGLDSMCQKMMCSTRFRR